MFARKQILPDKRAAMPPMTSVAQEPAQVSCSSSWFDLGDALTAYPQHALRPFPIGESNRNELSPMASFIRSWPEYASGLGQPGEPQNRGLRSHPG
jgi:hypothetical protein